MNCPQCSTSMVQAQATNFGEKYWYCRGCKKDLSEMQPTAAKPGANEFGTDIYRREYLPMYRLTGGHNPHPLGMGYGPQDIMLRSGSSERVIASCLLGAGTLTLPSLKLHRYDVLEFQGRALKIDEPGEYIITAFGYDLEAKCVALSYPSATKSTPSPQYPPGSACATDFIRDDTGAQPCRSVQGTPTHFWPHYKKSGFCDCGTYRGSPGDAFVLDPTGLQVTVRSWGTAQTGYSQPQPQSLPRSTRSVGASPALSAPYGSPPAPSGVFTLGQKVIWIGLIGEVSKVRHKIPSARHNVYIIEFDNYADLCKACSLQGAARPTSRMLAFDETTHLRFVPKHSTPSGPDLTEKLVGCPAINMHATQTGRIGSSQANYMNPMQVSHYFRQEQKAANLARDYAVTLKKFGEQVPKFWDYATTQDETIMVLAYAQSDTDITLRFMKEWAKIERPQIAESLRKKGWTVSEEEDK